MSQYKPYPAYKDSRVEWLGQVPEHWVIKKISTICQLRNGYPFDSKRFQPFGPQEDRLIRIRDLTPVESQTFTNENCPDSVIVRNGDILIGMDGDFNIIRWAGGMAKLNQRVCALNAKSPAEEKFVLYALSTPLKIINDLAYATTVKHLSSTEVLKTQMAIPPNNEELERLVICLDRETTRIDALVAKKTRFIELLREKRQALITHAVTKGLDPNVKMKDSGVEWLGEVPESWRPMQLKYVLANIEQGWSPECLAEPAEGLQWGIVKSGCVNSGKFSSVENKKLPDTLMPKPEIAIRTGDILMSRASGSLDLIGSVGLVENFSGNLMLSDKIFRLNLKSIIQKDFFINLIGSLVIRRQVQIAVSGAEGLANNLPQGRIKNFWFVLPPISEQISISEFIKKQTKHIDLIIVKTERSIQLLKERRSAFITAAVTGQIDLREAE